MTHLFRELQRRETPRQPIRTAVIGAGFMGKGLVYQLLQNARHAPEPDRQPHA